MIILAKSQFNWLGGSDKKIFKISANENTLWTLAAMLDFKSAPKTQWTFLASLVEICSAFQRRRFKCEKLMDGQTLTHDKISHGLWPGELKKWFFLLKQDLNLEFFTQVNIMRGKFVISNTTDNLLKRNRYKESKQSLTHGSVLLYTLSRLFVSFSLSTSLL